MSGGAERFQGVLDLDALAARRSPVHDLDPRAKLVTTLVFVATVTSFGRYEVAGLLPFGLYPLSLCLLGGVPAGFVLKRMALVSPFAVLVGVFNPLLDTAPLLALGPIPLSGGWVSFTSILLRFVLTVSAALSLVTVTGFGPICAALERLGAPRAFVVQLMFLYRYLFLLTAEAGRMARARALRSFDARGPGLRVFGAMVGHLMLRTLDRAQRVHLAMRCRGFDGRFHATRAAPARAADLAFALSWSAFFVAARIWSLPALIGSLLTGASS